MKTPAEWAADKEVPSYLLEMAMRANSWRSNLTISEKDFTDGIAAVSTQVAAPKPQPKEA